MGTIAPKRYSFEPEAHAAELDAIIGAIESASRFEERDLESLLRRHPKNGRGFFSKSELIRGYRALRPGSSGEQAFVDRVRMKPVRTRSGVAPVTVLTKPFPCPGRCIFCPSDVRMPKSYLSSEPGAQRAAEHQFDPFRQTLSRLRSFRHTGHPVDKVELIVLGGTWSSYPEAYRIWFVLRCFEAMNRFAETLGPAAADPLARFEPEVDFREQGETVEGALLAPAAAAGDDAAVRRRGYNQVVSDWTSAHPRAADQGPASGRELGGPRMGTARERDGRRSLRGTFARDASRLPRPCRGALHAAAGCDQGPDRRPEHGRRRSRPERAGPRCGPNPAGGRSAAPDGVQDPGALDAESPRFDVGEGLRGLRPPVRRSGTAPGRTEGLPVLPDRERRADGLAPPWRLAALRPGRVAGRARSQPGRYPRATAV